MDIAQLLTSDDRARKLFGTKEIEIVQKQVNNVRLTQSEKNRLSRDIRKKLDFVKELCAFQDEFDLDHGARTDRLIEEARTAILDERDDVGAILLFGSHARGDATIRSDIDLCVVFTSAVDKRDATLFRKRVQGNVSSTVNVHVWTWLSPKVKHEVTREHKVVYAGDFDNVSWTIKSFKQAQETKRRMRA